MSLRDQESSTFSWLFYGWSICWFLSGDLSQDTKSATLIAPAGFSKSIPDMKSWTTMPIVGDWFWRVFSDRLYGIGNMSETQYSDDPLSINEDDSYRYSKSTSIYRF